MINQAKMDAQTLRQFIEVERFKQWSYEEGQETFRTKGQNIIQQMAQIAMHGSCEHFIGMAIAIPPHQREPKFAYTFTKVLRDPGWMEWTTPGSSAAA